MTQQQALQFCRRLQACRGFAATSPETLSEAAAVLLEHLAGERNASDAVTQFSYRYPRWPGIAAFSQFIRDWSKAEAEQDPVHAQLLRLAQLPTSAVDVTVALAELERRLRDKGQNIGHIERAVNYCLDTSPFLPTPFELDTGLRVTAAPLPAAGCEKCNGTGFRRVVRTVHKPTGDEEYSAVLDCECLRQLRAQSVPPHAA